MTNTLALSRVEILSACVPSGGICAEIGVKDGWYSEKILKHNKPRRLHLIDPWCTQARDIYDEPLAEEPQSEWDARYAWVQRRFAAQVESLQVVIHRSLSRDIMLCLGPLDWVYIDGNHTYPAVIEDLNLCNQVVRPGGLILGHDFNDPRFGVKQAVHEFCESSGWELRFLTRETQSTTYCLGRC